MTVSVIGVVGAGFMGSGIAESAAAAGKHVIVYEPDDGPFERSRESLVTSLDRAVSRGKLDRDEAISSSSGCCTRTVCQPRGHRHRHEAGLRTPDGPADFV